MDNTFTIASKFKTNPALPIVLFSILLLLIRISFRGQILELDEAEQVVWGQQLLWGYPNQPPLYTWLQFIIFQLIGVSLLSVAVTKYLLLFGCFYYYHKICCLYISDTILAWCATLSWVWIPAISFDLLKDNTHSILVLMSACVTWYWVVAPPTRSQWLWYARLGIIMGCGFLSKYNYVLFLSILVISAFSLTDYRNKLINWRFLIAILVSIVIVLPYANWLIHHADVGLHTAYKIKPVGKSYFDGVLQVVKACAFFTIPVALMIYLFFSPLKAFSTTENQLLLRYHLICFPFLLIMVLVFGFKDFETRWLIPILFLFPVLLFSWLVGLAKTTSKKKYIILCLIVQLLLVSALVYRNTIGLNSHKGIAFSKVLRTVTTDPQPINYLISDSVWLLGNLQLQFQSAKAINIYHSSLPVSGSALLIWEGAHKPLWALDLLNTVDENNIAWIKNIKNDRIVAGQTYVDFNKPGACLDPSKQYLPDC